MKFRFCGDLDCPDWILAEINTLSKMSSIKMKVLCQVVGKSLVGQELDKEKAKKIIFDAKLDEGDMKACVSAVSFILSSSASHGVEEDSLANELQQLGLPKEHATSLCKVYTENVKGITKHLASKSLTTSKLLEASCSINQERKVEMNVKSKDNVKNVDLYNCICMSSEQVALLLTDLKYAREQMDRLPS